MAGMDTGRQSSPSFQCCMCELFSTVHIVAGCRKLHMLDTRRLINIVYIANAIIDSNNGHFRSVLVDGYRVHSTVVCIVMLVFASTCGHCRTTYVSDLKA
jgi:hypothetical protein